MYGVVAFVVAIFSSIAGGGGGFVATPLLILFGLSPAEAVGTGKLLGASIAVGNLGVMRKNKTHRWRTALPFVAIAAVVGIVSPFFITGIEGEAYQHSIGVLILLMLPVVHYSGVGLSTFKPTAKLRRFGYVFVAAGFMAVGVFSSGLGVLVSLGISRFFGFDMLEANVNKRISMLVLNSFVFVALLGSGLIVWNAAIVGAVANYAGGVIGAHVSVRRGSGFVMLVLKAMMLFSGVAMLVR